ncbi:uncharacterized protein LOC128132438 [Lactuca sativa]|uniref:uncharacterized protein LOC128132438 n=1 Tax=Lactuca sativa TaxID=4236 RepID=UPI0022AFF7A2|nr:uncharacterized protein LOC128132438 [Lactuca sativa]
MDKQATTLKSAIWAARNVETQIREKGLERAEVGEKRKLEGSSRFDKIGKFSKPNLDNQKYGAKWCEKCKKKHFRRCDGDVTCYKFGASGGGGEVVVVCGDGWVIVTGGGFGGWWVGVVGGDGGRVTAAGGGGGVVVIGGDGVW